MTTALSHGPNKAICDVCGQLNLRSLMIQRVGCGHWICTVEDTRDKCAACQMVKIREARSEAKKEEVPS
jgi:hypothetical protein